MKNIKKKEIIGSLKVINDTVEYDIKQMYEFNSKITKYEEQKQILLQVCIFSPYLFKL